ncbi:MAG: DHHA1 domain-containing protein, partial [Chitinophagaceae bacterium]
VILNDEQSVFSGYHELETIAKVVKYRKVKARGKEGYQIVLNKTPFYAESGGQVGDKGQLVFGATIIDVIDTKKENNLIIHFTENIPTDIHESVVAKVNTQLRLSTASNHTATHLLHAALRQVLGVHVAQKGSLVNDEQLRFDFSHFSKVTDAEIAAIESIVNEKVRANIPIIIKEMDKESAIQMGAMALFGEKYGDTVRVVIIDPTYSVELCGGTHVASTGELGFFKIIHESAVAAGVRRIEAVSGKSAESFINEQLQQLNQVKQAFNNPKELMKVVDHFLIENRDLKKKIEGLEAKQLQLLKQELVQKIKTINGVQFIGEQVAVSNGDALKKLCVDIKAVLPDTLIVLVASVEGKAFVAISIDETLQTSLGLDASKIIKEKVAPLIKGGGGGQKTLATAGGQDASSLQQVIAAIQQLIS